MTVYQILTRLWGKMPDFDKRFFEHVKELGVSHIWYTGIIRHATPPDSFVKGDWGSPYSISDWYDVNPYLARNEQGRLDEFRHLVDRTHKAGLKVIIDYIPNHIACNYSDNHGGLPHFGWCDYDWTDTLKVDWSNPSTLERMTDILRFWAAMGVDGFRCDMVEMIPIECLHNLIAGIRAEFPQMVFIAEAYNKDNYTPLLEYAGFNLLYDKSGLYDTLRAIICSNQSARTITWNWQWLADRQPRMLNFLENHDEQRVASQQFAGSSSKALPALAVSALFNQASFMLYSGQETGEAAEGSPDGRTSIFSHVTYPSYENLKRFIRKGSGLSDGQKQTLASYRKILRTRAECENMANYDLCWCNLGSQGFDPERHFAFMRYDGSKAYTVCCNFSPYRADIVLRIPGGLPVGEGTICVSVEPYGASISEHNF